MKVSNPFRVTNIGTRLSSPIFTEQKIDQYFDIAGNCIASSPGMLVAGGLTTNKSNMCWSIDNGITWYPSDNNFFEGGRCQGVAYSPSLSRWVAVGNGSSGKTVAYSDNGKLWIESGNFFQNEEGQGRGVAFGDDRFIIVGRRNDGGVGVAWSTDGINWATTETTVFDGSYIGNSVAYSSDQNKWVIVGENNVSTIFYSVNKGLNFLPSDNFFGNLGAERGEGNGISYSNNRWIAVGGNYDVFDNTRSIGYSDNGISWNESTNIWENGKGYSVSYGSNGRWFATGIDKSCYSEDNGITWNLSTFSSNFNGFGTLFLFNTDTGVPIWILVGRSGFFEENVFSILVTDGIFINNIVDTTYPSLNPQLLKLLPFFRKRLYG